jgi:hypothetical protein
MSKRFRVEFIPNTRFDYVGNFFAYNLDAAWVGFNNCVVRAIADLDPRYREFVLISFVN